MCGPADFLRSARSLIGTRYRLHGRDPHGVDCLGLVLLALRHTGRHLAEPAEYGLRNTSIDHLLPWAGQAGFARAKGAQCGDVLLVRVGPAQHHLAIRDGAQVIHAHAGLRRVVRQPALPDWRQVAIYRLAE